MTHYFNILQHLKFLKPISSNRVVYRVFILLTATTIVACGNQERKSRQTLARVNGEEITILQMNDELSRANVQLNQQADVTKQLLESLIDRHLIVEEAMRNKLHRTPEVILAIELAKAQIIEQSYFRSISSKIAEPSAAEVTDHFLKNPELFAERKQYDMQQIVISTLDLTNELKLVIDTAVSLEGIVTWLNQHNIRYARGQLSRNGSDLPEQMQAKLKMMKKGQFFILREGNNSLLNYLYDIKSSPVTLENAKSQIELYLHNKKIKQIIDKEISHLRSLAKIDYFNNNSATTP